MEFWTISSYDLISSLAWGPGGPAGICRRCARRLERNDLLGLAEGTCVGCLGTAPTSEPAPVRETGRARVGVIARLRQRRQARPTVSREPDDRGEALACVECGQTSTGRAERWRAYLDTEDNPVFYCPTCATRVFDDEPDTPSDR
jgi:hypothetical protein